MWIGRFPKPRRPNVDAGRRGARLAGRTGQPRSAMEEELMFTRRRIALACIVLVVVVAASAFYGYRRYAEEQARQVALTCLECIALAVSSETFKREFDTLVDERIRAETQANARRVVECWESVRSICESGPASSFDECVAERSMRLCGRQPSPRPGPVGPVPR